MFLGDNVVANVWSFSNKLQDIPYRLSAKFYPNKKHYLICNCPAYTFRKIKSCKHIDEFKKSVDSNNISMDNRFTLSSFGINLYKI